MEMYLPKGPVIERFLVSRDMSDQMLKYINPFLANSTNIEGRFSLDVSDSRVPLEQPELSEVAGRMTMHGLQVTPGASTMTIIGLAKQIKTALDGNLLGALAPAASPGREVVLMRMPEQVIDFRVQDGKVYHQGLVMEIDTVSMRTQGYVGIKSQELGIVVEIPYVRSGFRKCRV